MWTVDQFVADYIPRWEGGLSVDPNDAGNWSTGTKGSGTLTGSKYGVTARTLSAFRGTPVGPSDIKNLTLQEACAVAKKLFYTAVGLQNLQWNHVTASVLDFGWTAGPGRSIKLLQNLLDLPAPDGVVGPGGKTAAAFAARCVRGEEFMAGAWWAMREDYYESLVANRPSDGMYLHGWDNRSDYFTPGHPEGWWKRFG